MGGVSRDAATSSVPPVASTSVVMSSLETTAACVATERARHLLRLRPLLEPRFTLVAAHRVAVDRVLEPFELRLELVDPPLERLDARIPGGSR
jgi:hypothetical protein